MRRPTPSTTVPLAAAWLAILAASLACGRTAPISATATFVPPATSTATPLPTETAPPQLADKPTEPAPPPVVLLASGGNLNMRRGPGTGYNILAVLRDGDQGTATARNENGDWLYLGIPDQAGSSAWVSAASQYSTVLGEASGLPVMLVEPPVPAYIRNCLFHPVMIQPGNVLLPNQTGAPDNKKQFNPGIYEGFDQNVEGYPKIFSVELREGKTVDITKDGLNNTYACP